MITTVESPGRLPLAFLCELVTQNASTPVSRFSKNSLYESKCLGIILNLLKDSDPYPKCFQINAHPNMTRPKILKMMRPQLSYGDFIEIDGFTFLFDGKRMIECWDYLPEPFFVLQPHPTKKFVIPIDYWHRPEKYESKCVFSVELHVSSVVPFNHTGYREELIHNFQISNPPIEELKHLQLQWTFCISKYDGLPIYLVSIDDDYNLITLLHQEGCICGSIAYDEVLVKNKRTLIVGN